MADVKVRCTTCYNVFNTNKDEGNNVICPMCDSSFAVKNTNVVTNIKNTITDLGNKIGENIQEKLNINKDNEHFKYINGKKYDRELLEVAEELTAKKEEITIEGSKQLFHKIKDYDDYTQIEKQTVAYIRKKYKFTPEANNWLRTEIRSWAATKTRSEVTSDPTSSKLKKEKPLSFVFSNLKEAYRWDNLNTLNEKPKTAAQWAGILLSIVFILGILSGIAYGIKWNNQESQWTSDGLSSVHGTIIDDNGNGLEGVKIEADDKKTYTNAQGKYFLYDLIGDEVEIMFTMEGYGNLNVWINIRSEGTNILEVELEEGGVTKNVDLRKDVSEPWPPNYTLSPIFIVASIVALMGSSAALLQQNFRMAVIGCLCGVISYGFLIGSILSVVALSLILIDREKFDRV
jgi:hypothetical protein